jgi:hypothetical protein
MKPDYRVAPAHGLARGLDNRHAGGGIGPAIDGHAFSDTGCAVDPLDASDLAAGVAGRPRAAKR